MRTNAGEGSGSRLEPEVDPRSGLGLDADPERRRMFAPGTGYWGCGWPCSPASAVDGWASAGSPVAGHPFAAGEGGMEWYGCSQAGSIRYVDRATGGGQTCNDLAS